MTNRSLSWVPIKGDTWWFLPNSVGITNPSFELLDQLEANGINAIVLYYNQTSRRNWCEAAAEAADAGVVTGITTYLTYQTYLSIAAAAAESSEATVAGLEAAGEVVGEDLLESLAA